MKRIYFSVIFILLVFAGCKTTGKAATLDLPPGQLMSIERAVDGTQVTLTVQYDPSISENEIVIIAEKVPDSVSYTPTANPEPTFSDDKLIAWLFAKTPPQTLGQLEISQPIPSTITYQVSATPDPAQFMGKWGLKEADAEGSIGGGQAWDPCAAFNVDGNDIINLWDVIEFLDHWGEPYNGHDVVDLWLILELLDSWEYQC